MFKKLIKNPYLLAILSGLLCILSFPPFNFFFLIWFALVPFIYALVNIPYKKKKFIGITYYEGPLLGVVFGLIFYFGTLHWILFVFGSLGMLLLIILCIYPYIFSLLLNYTYHKLNKKSFILFLPLVFWTAIEYVKSEGGWSKFTWMNLGYSQHSFLPILQFADLFGQYGITAVILFVNSLIVYLLINSHNKKIVLRSVLALFFTFLFLLSYGFIKLEEEYAPGISVALIQDESSQFFIYENLISRIDQDVNFILLPEYSLPEYIDENNDTLKRIKDITITHNSYFIVGSKDRSENAGGLGYYNTAYLFNTDGKILGKYYKMNPIQFFNDGDPGKEYSTFETSYGKVGIMICYDMDYSYVARNLVKNGTELLFIPTYDAMRWSELQHKQHSAMTSMRAVENGRFIARTATSGISQIVDPKGRILKQVEIGKSDIEIGYIQKISKQTIYTRFGYLLPFLCIILALFLILYAVLKKK